MKNGTKRILMVLIGAYLAYTGFDLTTAVVGSSEKNKWIFLTFAVIFLVFGVALIIMNIKAFIQESQEQEGDAGRKSDEDGEKESDRRLLREDEEMNTKNGEEDREEESH